MPTYAEILICMCWLVFKEMFDSHENEDNFIKTLQ